MKLFFPILIFLVLNCSSIDIAINANKKQIESIKKIAVLDFDSKDKSRSEDFANNFAHQILKQTNIKVLERDKSKVSKLLNEQAFSKSGAVDDASATEVGKMLGVDSIIFGKIEILKGVERTDYCINTFNIKLINIETGNILINIIKEPGIEWTTWTRTKYILGLGLIWDKRDMLVETCRLNFLAENSVNKIKIELDKLNLTP